MAIDTPELSPTILPVTASGVGFGPIIGPVRNFLAYCLLYFFPRSILSGDLLWLQYT
jgi:hypothetical protein